MKCVVVVDFEEPEAGRLEGALSLAEWLNHLRRTLPAAAHSGRATAAHAGAGVATDERAAAKEALVEAMRALAERMERALCIMVGWRRGRESGDARLRVVQNQPRSNFQRSSHRKPNEAIYIAWFRDYYPLVAL